jgi:hypothetical protein
MKRSDPGNGCGRNAGGGRERQLDDDYTEFERQSGFAGERAYPPGWRPAWESGLSIDARPDGGCDSGGRFGGPGVAGGPGLEDRGLRESQETWRPAGPGFAPGGGVHRGRGPKGYRRSDARIFVELCDRLTDDGDVDATDVDCSVRDGEITLSGSVGTRPEQRRAELLAGSVRDVVAVRNRIRVRHETNP